ncbi:MAG TPA: DUF167 family protein [Acidimicrobiales bacterium]|nr:DUF167 family protein [Acidimicrobiales bacterium]
MPAQLFEVVAPTGADETPAITLHAQLHAGAGKAELTGFGQSALVLRVAAPPASPPANRAVRELVAELFGVAPEAVSVLAGERNAGKQLRVEGVDEAEATRLLDIARAHLGDAPAARGRAGRGH